jgi:hypothetical protein
MQLIYNKILFYSVVFIFFLSSAACNLAKVGADDRSENSNHESIINNSGISPLSQADSPEKKSPELTGQSVAGIYYFNTYKPNKGGYDNTLQIKDKGNGKLHIVLEGSNVWTMESGDETMHEASGEGDAQLSGNTATARITPDRGDQSCRVTLTFTANQVRVATAKNCTFNISLDGLYKKEKRNSVSKSNQTKNNTDLATDLQKVSYAQLSDFVNDLENNKPGKHFLITEVPAEKISKVLPYETSDKSAKGFYYFQTDDSDSDVSTMFVGSVALYKDYLAKVEYEPAQLRVTAVLIEFQAGFDFYRSPFVTKIEGLGDDGKAIWTLNGIKPVKVKFRQ